MSSRSITYPVKRKLFGDSANFCNLCRYEGKFVRHVTLEMAHIIAFADDPSAPRYVQGGSGDNSYENLILLCPNHHTEIDHKDNLHKYTIEFLKDIKKLHENFFSPERLSSTTSDDSILLQKIHENISFQTILNSLEWRPSYVNENVFELSTFVDLINKNTPTHFPFKVRVFNELTQIILENWTSLKINLIDQNMFNHLENNREFKMKYISTIDFHTIRLNLLSIVYALNRWINVVKLEYPKITLY